MNKISVNCLNDLNETLATKKNEFEHVFVLFTGSKNADGTSWCPDCNVAEPIIDKAIANYDKSKKALFVTAFVGNREAWKTPDNEYRKSNAFRLKSVPTLIKYGTSNRLEESQCANPSLIELLLSDE